MIEPLNEQPNTPLSVPPPAANNNDRLMAIVCTQNMSGNFLPNLQFYGVNGKLRLFFARYWQFAQAPQSR